MSLKSNYFWSRLFPVVFFMAFIFYMSSIPGTGLEGAPIYSIDKLYHIVEYGILSLLLLRLMTYHKVKHPYLYAILIAFGYGVTDEVHQLFVSGRVFSFLDMVANGVGASVILALKKIK